MKRFLLRLFILSNFFVVSVYALDARSYLVRYNEKMNQITTLSADLLVSSRMPGLTLADQKGKLRYVSPDKVDISGGLKDVIPPEVILINLHHVLMDSSVTILPDVEMIAGGVAMNIYVEDPSVGQLKWIVSMDTISWYIRDIFITDPPGNTVKIRFRQKKVQPDLFLPSSVEVEMISSDENKQVPNPRKQRIGLPNDEKSGTMSIRFSNYYINDPSLYEFFQKDVE
ncbi:MAG: hypothetical protein PHS99_00470 [Candidatus Marinimicrobia bacterium]|nr:hypothetical protein [Candidatus Neomarinimicrobiota bacterium]